MKFPFLQFDIGENDSYKYPKIPARFAGTKEDFDKFLEEHIKANSTIEAGETKIEFPFCCKFHKFIFDDVTQGFDNFPNGREQDIKHQKNPWFKISTYEGLPYKIATQIFLTEYHISKTIDKPDWYNDITEYIEYMVDCLGYPPVFFDYYLHFLKYLLENLEGNPTQKEAYKKVLDYVIEEYYTPKEKIEIPNLKKLYITYQKWIGYFPFNIFYFKELKEKYEKQLPIYFKTPLKTNRYTGLAKGKMHDNEGLIGILITLTKELLKQVNAIDLVKNSVIPNTTQHTLELLNEDLRINNDLLLGEFSKGETEYMVILQKWLGYQKEYFTSIDQLTRTKNELTNEVFIPEKSKSEILYIELSNVGFNSLPRVKELDSKNKVESLIELIVSNKTPYQIAMLNYLGLLDFLFEFGTKENSYRNLAKILNVPDRVIKGNCLVLNPKSSENRNNYTAHLHKKEVETDYRKIKLG